MRTIGILLAFAGLFAAFIYPSFQAKLSGKTIRDIGVYNRDRKVSPKFPVPLSAENNPIKLRITGKYLPGGAHTKNFMFFTVSMYGPDGEVVNEKVKLFYNSPTEHKDRDGTIHLVSHTGLFSITRPGEYTVEALRIPTSDFSLSRVSIKVLGNATVPNTSFREPGIIALVVGIMLFFRGRRRRKNRKGASVKQLTPDTVAKPVEEPAPEPPKKKTIRWGRNADKD